MFAYCNNNPINSADFSGETPVLLKVAAVAVAAVTGTNHIINCANESKIKKEISDTYTTDDATKEINQILSKYASDCEINFDLVDKDGNHFTEITNSYKVNSRYDRQKICTIIGKTGVTTRQYDDMAAECLLHNVSTWCTVTRKKGEHAAIDYGKDGRWAVRAATDVLELFGWL